MLSSSTRLLAWILKKIKNQLIPSSRRFSSQVLHGKRNFKKAKAAKAAKAYASVATVNVGWIAGANLELWLAAELLAHGEARVSSTEGAVVLTWNLLNRALLRCAIPYLRANASVIPEGYRGRYGVARLEISSLPVDTAMPGKKLCPKWCLMDCSTTQVADGSL